MFDCKIRWFKNKDHEQTQLSFNFKNTSGPNESPGSLTS